MKNQVRAVLLIWMLSILVLVANAKEITCTIKGEVIGRDSKTILLYRGTTDMRANRVVIPIVNKKFDYTFTVPAIEIYNLIFEDELTSTNNPYGYRPIHFFPIEGEVTFTLYPAEDFGKTKVIGGELNQQLNSYRDMHNSFVEVVVSQGVLLRELYQRGDGESPKAKALTNKLEEYNNEYTGWYNKYIEGNPSLFTYYLFTWKFVMSGEYVNDIIKNRFSVFSKLYPDHPYTELVSSKMLSLESIKVGGKFKDFSAPDLNGNTVKISNLLKQDFLLIDFWASWCGPCIRVSRTMIPLYQEFKDKGFSIIGVARETKDSEAMKRVMAREQYPWLNLIELDDKNNIWNKYNLSNTGGGTVLLNINGDIVAINPTADELRKILQEKSLK